jgi:hypothetical protein
MPPGLRGLLHCAFHQQRHARPAPGQASWHALPPLGRSAALPPVWPAGTASRVPLALTQSGDVWRNAGIRAAFSGAAGTRHPAMRKARRCGLSFDRKQLCAGQPALTHTTQLLAPGRAGFTLGKNGPAANGVTASPLPPAPRGARLWGCPAHRNPCRMRYGPAHLRNRHHRLRASGGGCRSS